MGHEDEAPVELGEAFLEHLEGRDVEVIRRLVEDEEIGGLAHEARDQDARLLPAGQAAHRHVELVGTKEEALGPRRHVDAPALEGDGVALGARARRSDCSGSRPLRCCSKRTRRRAAARSISPASGARVPARRLRSVVLPLPFGPRRPMRMPGVMVRSRSRTSGRPPSDFVNPRVTRRRRVRRWDDVKSMPAGAVTARPARRPARP